MRVNQTEIERRKSFKEQFNNLFLRKYHGEEYEKLKRKKIFSRRSSKQVIESDEDPSTESIYFQYPGEELIPVTGEYRTKHSVYPDSEKVKKLSAGKNKKYRTVHTHPYNPEDNDPENELQNSPIHSPKDIKNLLTGKNSEFAAVAQRDNKTGEVLGYVCILRKNRPEENFPEFHRLTDREEKALLHFGVDGSADSKSILEALKDLKEGFTYKGVYREGNKWKTVGLKIDGLINYRFVPAEGYRWDNERLQFVKKDGLENKIAVGIITIAFASSLFFLSSNFTGYSIANFSLRESNFISIRLFFIGLIFTYLLIKNKKKLK